MEEAAGESSSVTTAEDSKPTEKETQDMSSNEEAAASAAGPSSASAAKPEDSSSVEAGTLPGKTTAEPEAPKEVPMPSGPKTRYEWYQTDTNVVVEVFVKKVKKEDLSVDIQENTLSVTIKMPSGSEYSLELDLAHSVVPAQSQTKLMSTKVEIKMKKLEGLRWAKLEGDSTVDTKVKQFSPTKTDEDVHKYPTSAHYTRNWDKLVAEITEEEKNEKVEGDAAVNQLFQNIYGDGSDEVKKAMNKSFVESGGTVLSTNWKEVGNKKTEMKPPDGMEFKKY